VNLKICRGNDAPASPKANDDEKIPKRVAVWQPRITANSDVGGNDRPRFLVLPRLQLDNRTNRRRTGPAGALRGLRLAPHPQRLAQAGIGGGMIYEPNVEVFMPKHWTWFQQYEWLRERFRFWRPAPMMEYGPMHWLCFFPKETDGVVSGFGGVRVDALALLFPKKETETV
jgi:hypothetical protein